MPVTITQERGDDRVSFFLDGELFTAYVHGDPEASRPYWFPVLGPDGRNLTRQFPMTEPQPYEPTDHPHHRSLWGTHGDVNGVDNWNDRPDHGYTRFRRLEPQTSPDTLIACSDWVDKDENLLCHERLEVKLSVRGDGSRVYDWTITVSAPENAPVTLGDTKEGGLVAVRVAGPLQEDHFGRIANAEGGVGESECWGKPSRWCDYAGPLGPPDSGNTSVVGVALLSHPESYGHPTHWHVRAYGLFSANPFGLSSFTKGAENGTKTLAAGESLTFHYAVVLHNGDAAAAGIEGIWREWAGQG